MGNYSNKEKVKHNLGSVGAPGFVGSQKLTCTLDQSIAVTLDPTSEYPKNEVWYDIIKSGLLENLVDCCQQLKCGGYKKNTATFNVQNNKKLIITLKGFRTWDELRYELRRAHLDCPVSDDRTSVFESWMMSQIADATWNNTDADTKHI